MDTLTRNAALAAIFTLLWSACTTGNPGPGGEEAESEAESESEGEGDQPCPPEGCETKTPCRDDDNCPGDDPCRDYFCEGRDGFCRYLETDQDGDGYVRESCGGEDCDDRSAEECVTVDESEPCGDDVHPDAEEACDGFDSDCDRQEIVEQSCGPTCGTRQCTDTGWTACEGGTGEGAEEVCDGMDNNCNGEVDDVSPSYCDPVNMDTCQFGTVCYLSEVTYYCACPGTAEDGESCQVSPDCLPGLFCYQKECHGRASDP